MLSLIPISDANPTRRLPIVTLLLIVLNVIAFFRTPGLGQTSESSRYFVEHAPAACQLEDQCPERVPITRTEVAEYPDRDLSTFLMSILYSTFLHGGFFHIIGNMLFLWVFGNNVEDFLGRTKFLLFYLIGGILASLAHVFWTLSVEPLPCRAGEIAACVPSVGASGAVAAVMGAYLLLFPRARVNVLVPIFIIFTVIQMSALATLAIWFIYQFVIAWQDLTGATDVAWMAHVGGFVFG
ncbi:MAG: rhomboid family intramembrane serine protease, partial [Actinomycetota bacterium]|nr:rhomboid family intramembrane serine protease [Actinomycetota bacterium]